MTSTQDSPENLRIAQHKILARLDRITVWPYGWSMMIVLGIGYFIAFFDISNIGFSLPGYTKEFRLSESEATLAISLGVYAYIVGSYATATLAEYVGRRWAIFAATALFTVGGIGAAVAPNYEFLLTFRIITGMGIGAEIATVTTYISEISPPNLRGRFTSIANLFSFFAAGTVPLIALGIIPVAPWSWRIMFLIGAVGIISLVLVPKVLPESPRWLLRRGRIEEAERSVAEIETRAASRLAAPLPRPPDIEQEDLNATKTPVLALLRPPYRSRVGLLFAVWTAQYLGIYVWLGLGPTLLVKHGYTLTMSIKFLAVTAISYPLGSAISALIADRWERKYLVMIGALVTAGGALVMGLGSGDVSVYVASFLLGGGSPFYVPLLYALTAESFPTRARATGVSLSDGMGHIGGAVGPLVATAILAGSGAALSGYSLVFIYIAACFCLVACLVGFTVKATNRPLSSISR